MKTKKKNILKIMLSVILPVLMVLCSVPMTSFASGMNLGEQNNNAEIDISVSKHYGHELHTTTVNGQTYPLFCLEYGKKSPSVSILGSQGRPADATSLEAAEWIFAGYYMVHGNDIDWLDMAYAQKKTWEITGSNTNWTFSDAGYRAWCEQAENNMRRLETKPSFNNANVGKILAGTSKTITDTNGVLCDYPEFSYPATNGVTITHRANSNELTITVDKTCSETDFYLYNNTYWKTVTGQDSDCLIYNAKTGGTQKLLYSAYYDPVSFAFNGDIVPLGKTEITKQDHWGASVNGARFGLFTDAGCTNKVAEATSNGGKVVFEYLEPKSYFVKELSAPQGYLLDKKVIIVDVESNKTATTTVINDEPTGNITLTKELDTKKTNGKFGDVKIWEATYTLMAKTDIKSKAGTHTFYKAGEVISTKYITNKDGFTGTVTWEGLPLGDYTVFEETAPYGTFKDTNRYDVTLSYKDQTTPIIINNTTKSIDVLKSMKVNIYKTGTNGDAVVLDGVEGAEFTIKLKADYENALAQGYTYNEIWATKNDNGKWEVNGKAVDVSDVRVAQALKIAPNYDVITTDAEGNAVSTYLPFSWYICKETKTPKDFESCKDFSFEIKNDESEMSVEKQVKFIVPNNKPFEAPVKMIKVDADSGKLVTLTSTNFKIRATENVYDTSTGSIKYAKGEFVKAKVGNSWYDEFMTNSDGYVVPTTGNTYASTNDEKGTVTTPFKLPAGNYEICEIKTAKGFLVPDGNKPFVITNVLGNDTDADGDVIVPVTIKNEQPKANIIINKDFELREGMNLSLINVDYTKVAFELTAAENIIDMADGSIVYEKGSTIDTYHLDKNGKLEINDLWIGEYNFKEVSTIDGAVLDDTVYSIKFEAKDNTTKEYTETFNIVNYTTELDISKTDVTGEKEIEGAELTIVDKDNNIIDNWISTTESHKIEGLTVDEIYTLIEEIASNGIVTANSIDFTVTNTAEVQKVIMKDKAVGITKTDINGNFVKGAELQITNDRTKQIVDKWITGQHLFDVTDEMKADLSEGKTVSDLFINENDSTVKYVITPIKDSNNYSLMLQSDGVTDYYIIDINGDETIHLASGLIEENSYTTTEISTPSEFVTATPIQFDVTSEKENQFISMIDKKVEISKIDVTTGEELEGAELSISDTEGNIIEEWTSAKTVHVVTGLEEGKTYILTENTAPYGFEIAESIEFTVSTDKQTQRVVMKDDYIYSSVRVVKCDITTKKPIVSNEFEFSIYADKECTQLISTSGANKDEGTALFEKLKYGTYFIAETKAPLGYSLSDQVVEIVINENGVTADGVSLEESDGVYSFEYYDELLPIINTGDVNNTVKLAVMGGLLVVFIIIFVLVSKKMKNNKK